jgi:cation/acetate symporter
MKRILKPDLSDKEEVRYARVASFLALAVAVYFGINPPIAIHCKDRGVCIWPRRLFVLPRPTHGDLLQAHEPRRCDCWYALRDPFHFWVYHLFQFLDGTPDQYLLGITPEGIGFVGMLINFAVAFLVSAFTPAPPQVVQEMVENIHIPSGSGEASHH